MSNPINPTALASETLTELLRKCRCSGLTDDTIQEMVDAGLPVNGDGTISLVEYTAWLLKEVNSYGNDDNPA